MIDISTYVRVHDSSMLQGELVKPGMRNEEQRNRKREMGNDRNGKW